MRLLINETTIQAAAREYAGQWGVLINAPEGTFSHTVCEAIVDWVDQSGDQYMVRYDFVVALFPNFYY